MELHVYGINAFFPLRHRCLCPDWITLPCVHLQAGSELVGDVAGGFEFGVADDYHSVAAQRLFPVAALGADWQQVDDADVIAEIGHQRFQTFDALNAPLALGSLENAGGIVSSIDRLTEPAIHNRFCPAVVRAEIVGVIHEVDCVRARWPGGDLAKM